jgi:hypothetical protein
VPVRADGSFAYANEKRSFFVSAYDKPTAPFRNAEPAEYDSRMVGVSIKGRLENPSPTNREVSVSFSDRKKTGVINYGQGVEQPVFKSRAIEACRVIDAAEWAVIGESQVLPKDKDKEKLYLLVKAP